MKNFKRVISAVIALALSASTLVAVSASKFTDVDSTNSYAEAIESLAALDIVSGYEDGSFNPDGDITRAEAARMIVSALNMNADAAASSGDTQFADVNEKTSWAKGFVNVGVAQGYIHGMGDGTFAPQDKVTFAQMCVMLTTITGYSDYAAVNGGYPQGYIAMASTAGINKGVALAAETPLKRGQVAQMVYNAVTAPMLDVDVYKFDGNEYGKMDGITRVRKSLITEKFNAIEAKVSVDSFPSVGKVSVSIEDNLYYGAAANYGAITTNLTEVIVDNGIDLSGYIQQVIKGIFKLDENNKTHLIYAEGTSAVTTKEIAVADNYVSDIANKQIKFGTSKENFDTPIRIYVNGDQYPTPTSIFVETGTAADAATNAAIEKVLKNAVGTIKLAKVAVGGTVPANYNTIIVDAYQIAQVRSVSYESAKTVVGLGKVVSNNLDDFTEINITDNEIANGSVKLNITLNGEAIELKDLKKNDIVAIKTKVTGLDVVSSTNQNTDITILVSREVISGKLTDKDTEGNANKFVINGTEYKAADKTMALDYKQYNAIYLDAFGRIAAYNDEEVVENKNYAIVAKVSDGEATLVLADGSLKTYELGNGVTAGKTVYAITSNTAAVKGAANSTDGVEACVVEYKLKNGKISSLTYIAPQTYIDNTIALGSITGDGEYKKDLPRIGVVGINNDTKIIDVSKSFSGSYSGTSNTLYTKYAAVTPSQLSDGETYQGAAYGRVSGSVYSFVIITNAGKMFGANSRFAVLDTATGYSQGLDADGDAVDQLKVVANGKKTALNFKDTTTYPIGTHTRGDAFFYNIDSDGYAIDIRWINQGDISNTATTFTTSTVLDDIFGSGEIATSGSKYWGDTVTGTEYIRLVKGIVVGESGNKVKLLANRAETDAPVDISGYETLTLADDCEIYVFNNKTTSDIEDKDRVKANGVLVASDFSDWKITETTPAPTQSGYAVTDAGKIAWTTTAVPSTTTAAENWAVARGIKKTMASSIKDKKTAAAAQYAMALIVDGQVVEIYEIIQ